MRHGPACECGACRLARGLCPKCGREPRGIVMTWGKSCDLVYVNAERAKVGRPPLSAQEYEELLGNRQ